MSSQSSIFPEPQQKLRSNPSNSLQILDVGDAYNGWLKTAPHCKSLPVADPQLPRVSARSTSTNRSGHQLQVRSMSGFKEPNFADRQKAAQQAKQKLLDKFRSQPGVDDPEVAKRRAEREAIAANREQARLARETERAEQKR